MIKTFSNIVPMALFNKVKEDVESEHFPWYYVPTTAYTGDLSESVSTLHNGSFQHTVFNGVNNSDISDRLEDYLICALDACGLKLKKLYRIRVGMITVSNKNHVNPPHVDFPFPHKVGILYLTNSDGNTFIYNEKYDPSSNMDILKYYQKKLNSTVTVMGSVKPKENKFVMFDGHHYHSSSTPVKTKRRITINYVFEGE